jgi:ADP-ribosyl-[dinitrogen reductase] hydrolase
MGWVLTAFQNAFHWLLSGASLETALIATAGKGGDTDTNAAICGALLGAAQGREAVPQRWRNAILTCRPTEKSATRHPRPARYWPDDALDLAEALLAAGA